MNAASWVEIFLLEEPDRLLYYLKRLGMSYVLAGGVSNTFTPLY